MKGVRGDNDFIAWPKQNFISRYAVNYSSFDDHTHLIKRVPVFRYFASRRGKFSSKNSKPSFSKRFSICFLLGVRVASHLRIIILLFYLFSSCKSNNLFSRINWERVNWKRVNWSGLIESGLIESGLIGSGLIGSGLIGSGLIGSGLIGSGLIGSG